MPIKSSPHLASKQKRRSLDCRHTNKNWYGIKREIEVVLADTNLKMPIDQAQIEESDKGESSWHQ